MCRGMSLLRSSGPFGLARAQKISTSQSPRQREGKAHQAERTIIVTYYVQGLTHNSHSLKLDMV